MRFVDKDPDDPTRVMVNNMWLPTFVGFNQALLQELEQNLESTFAGRDLNEACLQDMHEFVIDSLCKRFPYEGLRAYLNGIDAVGSK